MTDLALLPCPKPCSECPDAEHHWIQGCCDEDDNPVDLACKHCDATAAMCDECQGPILPVVDDSGLCQDCKNAEDEDFVDVDPVYTAVGPDPAPEDE